MMSLSAYSLQYRQARVKEKIVVRLFDGPLGTLSPTTPSHPD